MGVPKRPECEAPRQRTPRKGGTRRRRAGLSCDNQGEHHEPACHLRLVTSVTMVRSPSVVAPCTRLLLPHASRLCVPSHTPRSMPPLPVGKLHCVHQGRPGALCLPASHTQRRPRGGLDQHLPPGGACRRRGVRLHRPRRRGLFTQVGLPQRRQAGLCGRLPAGPGPDLRGPAAGQCAEGVHAAALPAPGEAQQQQRGHTCSLSSHTLSPHHHFSDATTTPSMRTLPSCWRRRRPGLRRRSGRGGAAAHQGVQGSRRPASPRRW